MTKTKMNMCPLGHVYDTIEPGDIFYLVGDPLRHVVVLIFPEGIVDEEGKFIRKDRPIRYSAENTDQFELDYRFFGLSDIQIDVDAQPSPLTVGEIIVIFDRDALDEGCEKIEAVFDVIESINDEGNEYETAAGDRVSLNDLNFLPTGVSYIDEEDN